MVRKVYGVGVNDLNYKTQEEVKDPLTGKRKVVWRCPYYSLWCAVLRRCHSKTFLSKNKNYLGCTVSADWYLFSNFKVWLLNNNYDPKMYEIDKDILHGRHYSATTCVLIPSIVNTFILDSKKIRGKYLLGVSYDTPRSKYRACCRNPFDDRKRSNSTKYIGLFETERSAHEAWRQRKHQYACELAASEYVTDERVAKALRERYSFDNWYNLKETTNDQPK